MVKERAWRGAPLDSDVTASMLGNDEERRGDATMRNDHDSGDRADGVSAPYQGCPVCGESVRPDHGGPLDPCRVETRDKAGRPDPVLMGVLHAETRSFVDSGDIDGLAAAMRADADGLAERLALRARGDGRLEPDLHGRDA
jgi:hypothetical protein